MDCICLIHPDAAMHEHARNLAQIAMRANIPFRWLYAEHKNEIARFFSGVVISDLYLLAHSVKGSGIVLHGQFVLEAKTIERFFSVQKEHVPRFIFLNTCYGNANGFATTFAACGVQNVICAEGAIDKARAMLAAEKIFSLKYSEAFQEKEGFKKTIQADPLCREYLLSGFHVL